MNIEMEWDDQCSAWADRLGQITASPGLQELDRKDLVHLMPALRSATDIQELAAVLDEIGAVNHSIKRYDRDLAAKIEQFTDDVDQAIGA